ncbi:MAG TPA: lipoprotein-releasing ABC transporter permease subunit, partial [Gammaproteobacteria bacterium]|nr:lipoprotein-releasing ABC transporter permease subunit [Gammaproteobacteria bacterium]
RRNHFISFISLTSIVGVALGVMALITVLSVMNGFEKELTDRILGMASHATVIVPDGQLSDWQTLAGEIEQHPSIVGTAPYYQAEGMLVFSGNVNGVIVRGVLPEEEPKVSVIADRMKDGSLLNLVAGEFNIVIGVELARVLGVGVGDKVTLVAPQANVTPAGVLPRLKQFRVAGLFEIGMHEFDSGVALIHLEDAQRLFRNNGTTGLRLKTNDIYMAPEVSREIVSQLPGHYWVVDWTQRHANFFRALKTEKTVMFVILTLIVAVAAFNIISTLVMVVTDKQSDIAVLRTIGASPGSIMQIFIIQGIVIGIVGISLGVIGGVWLATNVTTLVPAIENFFQVKFLSPDVYYISDLPSDMHWSDVIVISVVAFVFCLLATIYPAWRAARTQPAEALRYE